MRIFSDARIAERAFVQSSWEATVINYRLGNDLDLDAVIDLYGASTLGKRRPLDDRGRMTAMLRNANLVVTAWDGDLLVGISRALTDFAYATYLSDLAVRLSQPTFGDRQRAHSPNPGSRRAASDADSALCSSSGGLLPSCGLHTASERMVSQTRRTLTLMLLSPSAERRPTNGILRMWLRANCDVSHRTQFKILGECLCVGG